MQFDCILQKLSFVYLPKQQELIFIRKVAQQTRNAWFIETSRGLINNFYH